MTPLLLLFLLLLLTVFALKTGLVSRDGALAGFLLGLVFAALPEEAAFVAFLNFVLLGSFSTKLGRTRKEERGVAQENRGRRGAAHALANVGPTAALALWARLFASGPLDRYEIAVCGGLAAVFADTIASEWGQWLGGQPRSILGFRKVPYGTDGGITLAGLLFSSLAAVLAGLLAWPWFGLSALVAVALAGLSGNLADSLLGAGVERHLGPAGGAIVNACAALVGMIVAYLLAAPA